MPDAATVGVLRKKVFFKISQNSQQTPVPEKTPVNFAKFLRTPFLQNNSERLLLKADIRLIQKRRHKRYFALGKPRKDWDETFSTLSRNICCVENEKQVILALWENMKKMSENLENAEENKKKK